MVKFKEFYDIDELNRFAATVEVMEVKYQYSNYECQFLLMYKEFNFSKIPTHKLISELKKRPGVNYTYVEPESTKEMSFEGSSIVLEVID